MIKRTTALLFCALSLGAALVSAQGREEPIEGHVIAVAGNHIHIDLGNDQNIHGGDVGVVKREGSQIGLASVVWVDLAFTDMRVLTQMTDFKIGDSVWFEAGERTMEPRSTVIRRPVKAEPLVEKSTATAAEPLLIPKKAPPVAVPTVAPVAPVAPLTATPAPVTTPPPAPLSPAAAEEPGIEIKTATPSIVGPGAPKVKDDFVPLLAPTVARRTAQARTENVFHGSLNQSDVYQYTNSNKSYYMSSRIDTNGSVDRIMGELWALSWSGNSSYRNSSIGSTSDDYRKVVAHLYTLTATKKSENNGLISFGRFFPNGAPGLGYMDGAQIERQTSNEVRVGAAAGARPDPVNQGFSDRQITGAVYASLDHGNRPTYFYSGTLGILQSMFLGKADELAAILNQRLALGTNLNLNTGAQAEFNEGQAQVHHGVRFSRLDANLNASLTSNVSVRAGANHYEPLDNASQRFLTAGTTNYINNGYWHYYGGSNQSLPWEMSADEDISFTESANRFSQGSWRMSLGRRGLPGWQNAFTNFAFYNIVGSVGPSYGATLSFSLPSHDGRFSFSQNTGMSYGPVSSGARQLQLSDFSLNFAWRISNSLSWNIGASQSLATGVHNTSVNTNLGYRW